VGISLWVDLGHILGGNYLSNFRSPKVGMQVQGFAGRFRLHDLMAVGQRWLLSQERKRLAEKERISNFKPVSGFQSFGLLWVCAEHEMRSGLQRHFQC